ncbi:hypothetical protein [Rheinheimera aquimaris]|uniref:hypothetical protein n=1 Tax=Rheinheimera aquimaris TaxID=412437 RepID=UPI003A975F1F
MAAFVTLTEAVGILGFDRKFILYWLKERNIVPVDYLFADEPLFWRHKLVDLVESRDPDKIKSDAYNQPFPSSSLESVGCDNKVLNNATVGLSSAHYDVREQNPAPAGPANIDGTADAKVGRLEQAAPAAREADVSQAEPLVKADSMVQAVPLTKPAPVTQAASMIQGEPEVQPADKAQAATKRQTELFAAPAPVKQPACSIQGEATATPAPPVKADVKAQVRPIVQPSPATQAATAIQPEAAAIPTSPAKADADVQVTPIVHASPAVHTASVVQPAPFDQNEPVTQTASKALSEPEIQHVGEVAAKGKDVSVTQNDPDAQTAAGVTAETTVDHLASAEQFKLFLKSLPEGTYPVDKDRYKYLKVRVNQGSTVIYVVVKGIPRNQTHTLLTHQNNTEFDEQVLAFVIASYRNFLRQYEAKPIFGLINWLPNAVKTRITTPKQLLMFELEHKHWTSKDTKRKARNIFKRYFDCKEGDLDLRDAKTCHLEAIFVDKAAKSSTPSDRDELIKRLKAALHFASDHPNVEKLEFGRAIEELRRNRESYQHLPDLKTYVSHLCKAVEFGFYDLALFMILQEQLFTRVKRSILLRQNDINFDECLVKILGHEHKNHKNAYYYFPVQLIPLLRAVIDKRSCNQQRPNPFIFPSLTKDTISKPDFYNEFGLVRDSLIDSVKQQAKNGFSEEALEISKFTFHRIRNLNLDLLYKINVWEGQAENAHNRKVSDKAKAYEDLSARRQREFKSEKYQYITGQYPEYDAAVKRLIAHYRSN